PRTPGEARPGGRPFGSVRVQPACEPPEGLLDLALVGVATQAQQLVVVVFGRGHPPHGASGGGGLKGPCPFGPRLSPRSRPPRRNARARARRSGPCGAPS